MRATGRSGPDFFIVGAPKCATSSLYAFFEQHDGVFMTTPKEPHHFCADLPGLIRYETPDAYLALFEAAPAGAVCGEASAFYLCSRVAARAIHAFNPEAKIILSVRNPIDASLSWHQQLLNGFREDRADFEESWDLQEERAAGRRLPAYCPEPRQLQYRFIYRYAEQVERYLDAFGPERVKILLFDDIVSDPRRTARDVLAFLGLPPPPEDVEVGKSNARTEPRYPALQRLIAAPPAPLRPLLKPAKRLLNAFGVVPSDLVMRRLSRTPARREPSPELRARLLDAFADDVAALERLTGIDLSAWEIRGRESAAA